MGKNIFEKSGKNFQKKGAFANKIFIFELLGVQTYTNVFRILFPFKRTFRIFNLFPKRSPEAKNRSFLLIAQPIIKI